MRFFAFIFLILISGTALGQHCSMVPLSESQKVSSSTLIVEGKITQQSTYWNPSQNLILTQYTVQLKAILKGVYGGSAVTFVMPGGMIGNTRLDVTYSPEIRNQDEGIFFLQPSPAALHAGTRTLTGAAQGFIYFEPRTGKAVTPFLTYSNAQQAISAVQSITGQYTVVSNTLQGISNLQYPAYLPIPNVSSLSPLSLSSGTGAILTINGNNFGTTAGQVFFKDANNGGSTEIAALPSDIVSWTNTQIQVKVPTRAGTGVVRIQESTGLSGSSSSPLTVLWAHLNNTSAGIAYPARHIDFNGAGGITWSYHTAFTNPAARASFERALSTWRCNTFINWNVSPATTNVSTVANDGISIVAWDSGTLPMGVLGACFTYYGSCTSGGNTYWHRSSLDILYSPTFTWQYGPALPGAAEYDFESVSLHELGHAHGLGHVINNTLSMHYSIGAGVARRNVSPTSETAGGLWTMSVSTVAAPCGGGPLNALSASNCSLLAPTALFSSNTVQVCPGGTVNFTDISTGNPTSWNWSFPGGTPNSSTLQNPTVTYAAAGTYAVTLTASNASGTDTETINAYITVGPPTATITGTQTIFQGYPANLSIALTGTAPWSITIFNGTTSVPVTGILTNPYIYTVSPAVTTTYTVTAVSDAGCTGTPSGSATVTVNPPPPLITGNGLPVSPLFNNTGSPHGIIQWQGGPVAQNLPFGQTGNFGIHGHAGFDDCGNVQIYIAYSGSNAANQLMVYAPDGTLLTPGNGMNGMPVGDELQMVRVPKRQNEWYIFYRQFTTNTTYGSNAIYYPTPNLYSRVKYECGVFSYIVKDQLLTVGGVAYTSGSGKAIAANVPGMPGAFYLYTMRKVGGVNQISLDRWIITENGITWNANTGNVNVNWWYLSVPTSDLEVTHQGDRIVYINANETIGTAGLVIFNTTTFNAATAIICNLNTLIVQPDGVNLLAPTPVSSFGSMAGNPLQFIQNLPRKIRSAEWSPSGQYLYLGEGGYYFASGCTNVTYLLQVDVTGPQPWPVRVQSQRPPGTLSSITGGGSCGGNASTLNRPIRCIESAFDGRLYFNKPNADTLFVIPTPDLPMPISLLPSQIDLSTPTAPNIPLPFPIISIPEPIDGYDYIRGTSVTVEVNILGCQGCLASPASPQTVEIISSGGMRLTCGTVASCPGNFTVCVDPDSTYSVKWGGTLYNNVIVNGTVNMIPVNFTGTNPPIVTMDTLSPSVMCDTLPAIALAGYPAGGTFAGPGVTGNNFSPGTAGLGPHTLTYTYTDPQTGCEDSAAVPVTIISCCASPSPNLGPDVTGCEGDTLQLNSGVPAASHLWSDMSIGTTLLVTTSGVYSVQVTDSTGCQQFDTVTVTLNPVPVVNLGPDVEFCEGGSVNLDAGNPGSSYNWNNIAFSQTITVNSGGTWWVEVSNGPGCIATDTITITEFTNPLINIGPDLTGCTGDIFVLDPGATGYDLLWSDLSTGPTLTVNSTGVYAVTATDSNGCTASDTVIVSIFSFPVVNLGPDAGFCEGNSLTLDAGNPGSSFTWNNSASTQTLTVNSAGTYWVEVVNAGGCSRRDTIEVIEFANPVVDLGPDGTFCEGTPLILDAGNPGASYLWNNSSTTQSISPGSSGSWSVTVTTAQGCISQDQVNLIFKPDFTFSLGPDTTLCNSEGLMLIPGLPDKTFSWSTGETTTFITVLQSGTYSVTISDECFTHTDEISVTLEYGGQLYFGNAFTPNGDGINDEYKPVGLPTTDYYMAIFDRWGMKIFETTNLNTGWDGNFSGQQAPEGVYVAVISYVNCQSKHAETSVNVTLLR